MRRLPLIGLSLILALSGCDDGEGDDAGPPGDAGDGTRDAGPPFDAGPGTDGGGDDAGPGNADAGPPAVDPCMGMGPPALGVENVGTFNRPVLVTYAPGDTGAIYVVEQRGRVQRVAPGGAVDEFARIAVNRGGNEQGLLGMAFHPDYATNGRFFLYYTAPNENHRLTEHVRDASDPTVAQAGAGGNAMVVATLVDEPDFAPNHNGGMTAFGPDGFLYLGLGDGGGGGDPRRQGLDTSTLLGKILRLDVDNPGGDYAAAGNPFVGGGGLPQIWAYGLRNPWRFSFDRATGDLWIGDVGQNAWEEIDFQPASSTGGVNYGWRAYEGTREFARAEASDLALATNHTPPIYEYAHTPPCTSVAGGYVYRGSNVAGLRGYYLFGDLCDGQISALRSCPGGVDVERVLGPGDTGFSQLYSFGEDENGELYITAGSGAVVRIIGG